MIRFYEIFENCHFFSVTFVQNCSTFFQSISLKFFNNFSFTFVDEESGEWDESVGIAVEERLAVSSPLDPNLERKLNFNLKKKFQFKRFKNFCGALVSVSWQTLSFIR